MGNLARAAFPTSTKGVWPWSYDACDGSVPDLDRRQETNACSATPGHGFHPHQGRGSPEMDIFEVNLRPSKKGIINSTQEEGGSAFMSASLQVAPGVPQPHRPVNGHPLNESYVWYEAIEMSDLGEYNSGFWGQEVWRYFCSKSLI